MLGSESGHIPPAGGGKGSGEGAAARGATDPDHADSGGPGGQPVSPGDARGVGDQPQGLRGTQGPVAGPGWPTFEEVVGVLYELASELFGSAVNPYPAFRIDDRGLLESAIALPHQDFYETFSDKLAAMVRSIAANHALQDGNKRLAVAVLHSTVVSARG